MKKIIQIQTLFDDSNREHRQHLLFALTADGQIFFKDTNDRGHSWESLELVCEICENENYVQFINEKYICGTCQSLKKSID